MESSGNNDLLELAVAGDEAAFEELFSAHKQHLRRFIELRMDTNLKSRIDVSDVLQETQIQVHRRLGDYHQRRPMPLRVWLQKTAYERLLKLRETHLNTAIRTVSREVPMPDRSSVLLAQRIVHQGPTPCEQAVLKERQLAIAKSLSRLSFGDREILLMRIFEGLEFQEIGYILDISVAAARKRCARSMIRIQKQLELLGLGGSVS